MMVKYMNIERNFIITILKLTKEGTVLHELIKKEARISRETSMKLLEKFQNDGLIILKKDIVEVDSICRLKLAINAVNLGADIEHVVSFLQWREFENIAARILEENNYTVKKNFRFKYSERKWEIDIIGFKKPLAICIDCKHWHRGMHRSTLKRIVNAQVERVIALAKFLPNPSKKIECNSWNLVKLIPAVLSLIQGQFKFYDNVPVVSILQLQDFIHKLPVYADSLKLVNKTVNRLL